MAQRFEMGANALGALAAGALFALGGAPRLWWACSLVAGCALFALLARAWSRAAARPTRDGLLVGLLFGIGANAVALSWSSGLLVRFGGFPWAGALATSGLLYAAQALPYGLAGLIAGSLEARRPGLGWLGFAAALPPLSALVPAVFPWRVGVTTLALLPAAQLAEVGGEPLVDLFLLGVAGATTRAAARGRPGELALVALVVAGVLSWGADRIAAVREARGHAAELAIGVVQPNVPVGEKRATSGRGERLRELREATRTLESMGADVVVWPETAHPYGYARDAQRDLPAPFAATGGGVRGPLIVGALTRGRAVDDEEPPRFNSVLSIDERGAVRGVSDKVVLVPFGERVPLCGTLLPRSWFAAFGGCGLSRGERPRVLPAAGARVGVLNCYEDVLGAQAARVARDRPDVLVNVTNDAWFGDTDEPHLHLLVSRMRAIEARRDLIRATNTGVSAHVLATGEVAIATPVFAPTAFVAPARLLAQSTPWTRRGDWVTPSLAGALLGAAAGVSRLRARTRPRGVGSSASR